MTEKQQEKFILVLFLVVIMLGSLNILGGDNLAPNHNIKIETEREKL